jgi:hypothetical protein
VPVARDGYSCPASGSADGFAQSRRARAKWVWQSPMTRDSFSGFPEVSRRDPATSGAVYSAVGVGKVGKGRLVDAEVAGAGERSYLEVDAGAVGVQVSGAFHGGGVAAWLVGEVLR